MHPSAITIRKVRSLLKTFLHLRSSLVKTLKERARNSEADRLLENPEYLVNVSHKRSQRQRS
jgi:nucleoside-triphosphatase THEP1